MDDVDANPSNYAERWLLACAIAGEWADFIPPDIPVLRASFLRHLLLGLSAPKSNYGTPWPTGPVALRIRNARIEGALNLTDGAGPGGAALLPLLFERCDFADPIDLSHARLSRLSIKHCRILHLIAHGMRLDGPLDFSGVCGIDSDQESKDGPTAWIDAHGARISGDVEGADAQLRAPPPRSKDEIGWLSARYALDFSNCHIGGRIILTPNFHADGGISFGDADIKGEVWLTGARLFAAEGIAFKSDACRFGSAVVLNSVNAFGKVSFYGASVAVIFIAEDAVFDKGASDRNEVALDICGAIIEHAVTLHRVKMIGQFALSNANIGGDLHCCDGVFTNRTDDGSGKAIFANSVVVGGQALFIKEVQNKGFKAEGELDLQGAKIGGSLVCSHGMFLNRTSNGNGVAIRANSVLVGGTVHMQGEAFRAEGQVSLIGAKINGDLICNNATFLNGTEDGKGMAIVADNISIGGSAYLRWEKFRAEGRVVFRAAKIAGTLECDSASFLNRQKDGSGHTLEGEGLRATIVRLCENFHSEGTVVLRGAEISGSLICYKATFTNATEDGEGEAIDADGIRIGGEANFNSSTIEGEVSLIGSKIALHLRCWDSVFRNQTPDGSGIALLLEGANVGGAVMLRGKKFKALGQINLLGAKVGHELECMEASFINPHGATINGRRASIRGSAKLSNASGYGEVGLDGATIDGDLLIDNSTLTAGNGTALTAENVHVRGSFDSSGAILMGDLVLSHINVRQALNITRMAFPSVLDFDGQIVRAPLKSRLNLEHARIGAEFTTDSLSSALPSLVIDLRSAHVHTLDDGVDKRDKPNLSGWGGNAAREGRVELALDGFTYDRLADCEPTPPKIRWLSRIIDGFKLIKKLCTRAWGVFIGVMTGSINFADALRKFRIAAEKADRDGISDTGRRMDYSADYELSTLSLFIRKRYSPEPRLEWLALQKQGEFFPQPYRHLAKALRAQGHEAAAREVAMAEIDRAPAGFWYSLIKPLFRLGFGYGLHPLRACCSLLVFVLIGWLLIAEARSSGALVLTTTPVVPIVATGALLPPVEPTEIICGDAIVPLFYAIDLMLPIIPLHQETRCDISADPKYLGWQWAKFIFSILGKLVTALALLTFSGVLKTQPET